MPPPIIERHERLWRSLSEDEEDAAHRAEGLLASTVWARTPSDRWWVEPLKGIRAGYRPGRDLARPPKRRAHVEELDYDPDGRLVRGRRWLSEEVVERRYVAYTQDTAAVRDFATAGGLRSVSRIQLAGSQVVALAFAMRSPWTYVEESFEYDAEGRLMKVAFERHNEDTMSVDSWRKLSIGEQSLDYQGDTVATVHERYAANAPSRQIYPPAD